MRLLCCCMLLAGATIACAQMEPCLAGVQDPGCGIKITMNPPLHAGDNVLSVPNEITIEVPQRIKPIRVAVLSGPTGGAAEQFKPFAEIKHSSKDGGNLRFKLEMKSCPGNDSALNFNIYSPKFPYPISVPVQPFVCKPQGGQ